MCILFYAGKKILSARVGMWYSYFGIFLSYSSSYRSKNISEEISFQYFTVAVSNVLFSLCVCVFFFPVCFHSMTYFG